MADHSAWAHFGREDGPELWYTTPTGRRHYIHFNSLQEGIRWIRQNHKRIRPQAGSWQLLDLCDTLRTKPPTKTA